jgi:protein N-terminal methyltransferase
MDMTIDPPPVSLPDSAIDHTHALSYWNSVSSDNNGMLGGYPHVSLVDLKSSSIFLAKLRRGKQRAVKQDLPPLERVADCGAGIGRITKGLLMRVARTVDVVEPVEKFTDELVREMDEHFDGGAMGGKIGEVVNLGLQDWVPEEGAYDLIWNQWCLGHLTDAQLIVYLRRCKDGLRKASAVPGVEAEGHNGMGGWIVVKENLSSDPKKSDIYDEEDSSVTRHDEKFKKLFKEAGLKVVATELQRGFPKELFAVRMYALQPG